MTHTDLPDPSRLWCHMQDTHGISLLVSEEADIIQAVNEDHALTVESLLQQREALETELAAWQSIAHQLAAALEATREFGDFPGPGDSAIRTAALESYARLRTGFNSHEL